ncbi:MAG TPA: serine hydrolase [Candidatus Eremiobacteraceae bacterium]|nr:serine hydrolase [Candidatus Eremiobacteraceae bacterium]
MRRTAPRQASGLDDRVAQALDGAGLRECAAAHVFDLRRRVSGSWHADADIYPASVVKVPIMCEAHRRFACGELEPGDEVTVDAANETTTWGGTPFSAGSTATLGEMVERMITHSDNVATNQLMDVLRRERVTAYMHLLGLKTFLLGRKLSGSDPLIEDPEMTGRNRLPPDEIGLLLRHIADDAIPGAAIARDLLQRCVDADKFVPGLRPGDVLMHKTGETSEYDHDAGILKTVDGGRYVVVLYTKRAGGDDIGGHAMDTRIAAWMRAMRAVL